MNYHNLDFSHKLMYASLTALTLGGAAYGANALNLVDLNGLTANLSLVGGRGRAGNDYGSSGREWDSNKEYCEHLEEIVS